MRRAVVIFLTQLLLWVIVAQANHYLAPRHVYLFAGGLFVTFAALRLPLRTGFAAALLGGMLCDATAPVRFGTFTLLFALAYAAIFNLRDRLPREEPIVRVLVALLANLALFLVVSFLGIADNPAPSVAWTRLFFDLLCSQAALALAGPWFFALQGRALELARTEPVTLD
jgi:rod shape-determining protein MreD